MLSLRQIACAVFRQLPAESSAHTVTLQVTLGRMSLAHYNKAVETFPRVRIERHALHITSTILAIAFYVNGL